MRELLRFHSEQRVDQEIVSDRFAALRPSELLTYLPDCQIRDFRQVIPGARGY